MSRWLALDHGLKRIGAAVGDSEARIASPVAVITSPKALAEISLLASEYSVDGIVVGWPINSDGTEGPQGQLARQFAVTVREATGRDVRLWDERLSSFQADQQLRGLLTRGKKKAVQDSLAAAAILHDFLARNGPTSAPRPEDAVPPGREE